MSNKKRFIPFTIQRRFPIKVITTIVASAQLLLSGDDAEYVSHVVEGSYDRYFLFLQKKGNFNRYYEIDAKKVGF